MPSRRSYVRFATRKRLFYLVLVFAVGLVAAGLANSILEWRVLLPIVLRNPWARPVTVAAVSPQRQDPYLFMAERNLLGARREDLTKAGPPSHGGGAVAPCSLAVNLRGTVVPENAPQWSLAVLQFGAGDAGVFTTQVGSNEIAPGIILHKIAQGEVLVTREGHIERCATQDAAASKEHHPAVMVSGLAAQPPEGITKTAARTFWIDREYLTATLNDLNRVLTQARAVPAFRAQRAIGYRMIKVARTGFFDRIGLRRGDVIRRVNGHELTSPDIALQLFQRLKSESDVVIDLERRGAVISHEYAIR